MRISHSFVSRLALVAGATLFSSSTTAVSQEARCGPDGEALIAHLEKEWGESVKAIAVNRHGNLVRWLSNEDTGTWSMVETLPSRSGETTPGCLRDSGQHFEIIPVTVGAPS